MKDPNMQIIDRKPWLSYYTTKLKYIYSLEDDIANNLVKTYGQRSFDVAEMALKNPGYMDRIVEGQPFIVGEIFYSIENEMAVKVSDLVMRRFKVRLLDIKKSKTL